MNKKEFIPKIKQIFYVFVEEKDACFYQKHNDTHIFTSPLIVYANFFINKEIASKYKELHKLKNFTIIKVTNKYSYE